VIQIGFQYRLGNERRSYRTRSGQSPWWIEWKFLPLDHQNRKYIAVYLDNPSDYIIRGATVSAQIKLKSAGDDAAITVARRVLGHILNFEYSRGRPQTGKPVLSR
jgi:hypothetical protein